MNEMMWVALVEFGDDEEPHVSLSHSKERLQRRVAQGLQALWHRHPDAFADDGPAYMAEHYPLAPSSPLSLIEEFLDGLREATTVPYVTITEEPVL